MKELVYSVEVGTRDALLGRILVAADRIRNSQWKLHEQLAQWNFQKPALSTDQFKLKVISRG
jgi:hypothetical protein